jgi:hypothetical protein
MSRSFVGFNVGSVHKETMQDEAACLGLPLGRYLTHMLPLDATDGPPRTAPRSVVADEVFVIGYRDGVESPAGSLSSILRADPDGRRWSGHAPVVITPKEAVSAILHHIATGRVQLTANHMHVIQSLRTSYDN